LGAIDKTARRRIRGGPSLRRRVETVGSSTPRAKIDGSRGVAAQAAVDRLAGRLDRGVETAGAKPIFARQETIRRSRGLDRLACRASGSPNSRRPSEASPIDRPWVSTPIGAISL